MVEMPTGEEPPKGFECFFNDCNEISDKNGIRIDCVAVSQLAANEKMEIDHLRQRACDYYLEVIGIEPNQENLEYELSFAPVGKTVSDKLIYRSYSGKFLVGYGQVLCSWPEVDEWTIMTLVLDPQFRLQGIGTSMIHEIERHAKSAQISAARMVAMPTRVSEDSFWSAVGYTTEVDRFMWNMESTQCEVIMLRKDL